MRFIGYVRVSTEEQDSEGNSPREQEARIYAWADANGHKIIRFEKDLGVSGSVAPSKRNLGKALEDLPKLADGVVATRLNRFSRSIVHVLELVELSDRRKFALVSLSESLDTSSATGRLIVGVLGLLAQFQREQIAEDSTRASEFLRKASRRFSRHAPYGWRYEGSRMVEDVDEQMVLSSVDASSKLYSRPEIAKRLNGMGYRARHGGPFKAVDVSRIVRAIERQSRTPSPG